MYCEFIDYYFNIFFVKIQQKKKTLKVFFGHQNLIAQTSIAVYQTA